MARRRYYKNRISKFRLAEKFGARQMDELIATFTIFFLRIQKPVHRTDRAVVLAIV
jgi:hypothetical protein